MKYLFLTISLFLLTETFGQKLVVKELDAASIDMIIIDANEIFDVKLISEKRETIQITTQIEGEYTENTLLKVKEKENTLLIGSGFTPFFKKHNDKLAAHKMQSMSLRIKIPEGLHVSITSNIANLNASGAFEFLFASLENGYCKLTNFQGDADLQTTQGNITISTKNYNVMATLESKYGTVLNNLKEGNTFRIDAYSIHGDILLIDTN